MPVGGVAPASQTGNHTRPPWVGQIWAETQCPYETRDPKTTPATREANLQWLANQTIIQKVGSRTLRLEKDLIHGIWLREKIRRGRPEIQEEWETTAGTNGRQQEPMLFI